MKDYNLVRQARKGLQDVRHLDVIEDCGDMSRSGPAVGVFRQHTRVLEAIEDRTKRVHTVRRRRHMRYRRAGHIFHLQIGTGVMKQHHDIPVIR